MPIFGVIKLTFEREGGSIRGEDDFFSVARTMPLVAMEGLTTGQLTYQALFLLTLDSKCSNALVDSVQGIF